VADIVNERIQEDLPVHFEILDIDEAKRRGAIGLFEDKYAALGNKIKVYFIGTSPPRPISARKFAAVRTSPYGRNGRLQDREGRSVFRGSPPDQGHSWIGSSESGDSCSNCGCEILANAYRYGLHGVSSCRGVASRRVPLLS
jgi:hypothetical protein